MSTRRTHTKSRTGCSNCKRRKVKCDEAYPTCFNCKRHGVPCSLSPHSLDHAGQLPTPDAGAAPERSPLTPASTGSLHHGASPTDPMGGVFPGSDQILPCAPSELWIRDLELLHHFVTATAQTLAIRPDNVNIWQNVIPREGYRTPFVMHGVLSIAAVHKAYLIPAQRKMYLALSDYHHTVGSEGFRPQLERICDDNWSSVFSFATIVVLYMISLPHRSEGMKLETPIVNFLELMSVVRGIQTTLAPILPRVVRTEFAPVVYGVFPEKMDKARDWKPPLDGTALPVDSWDAFQRLRDFQRSDMLSSSVMHYDKAMDKLEDSTKLVAVAGVHAEVGTVLSWPYGIHESIMVDFQTRKPHALLLLAHVAILFASLEKCFWFTRGWSRSLLDEIDRLLADQPRFLTFLEWPKAKMAELYDIR